MSLSDGLQENIKLAIKLPIRRKDRVRMTCFFVKMIKGNLKISQFEDLKMGSQSRWAGQVLKI